MKLLRRIEIDKPEEVYNLHIRDDHNYIVQGAVVSNCHLAKGDSLQKVLKLLVNAEERVGLTGTLDGAFTNEMLIKGMLGPVKKIISASEAIDQGHLSDIKIRRVVFNHNEQDTKWMKKKSYQEETDFVFGHRARNDYITSLVASLKGNTLVLYTKIEKHGDLLNKLFAERITDRPVFYVHGGVDAADREEIRSAIKGLNESVTLASQGVFSTGVNIPNIDNIVFASPSKSTIRVLQSIGRGLRKADGKTHLKLYDLIDKFSGKNYCFSHGEERMKIYNSQGFQHKTVEVNL
jgi:superfamily II DNA or RNA helicase